MNENHVLVEFESKSAKQTFSIGFAVGRKAREGDVFALTGELGSGKTCFTGGLARGLGVGEEYAITSPTFTLINEYPGRCRLCHFDLYRLNHSSELLDLGYEEYISGEGVVVIEWAEKIAEVLPGDVVSVCFRYVDESKRIIGFIGTEKKVCELVQDISRED
ncbi:MAG TPA: tRNA (adenosine(37)-N6)-threonylcarbamoyltransferase complex ATPase subunit type 1 TsaE [Smithellaceae bacterium]|nr:tRNA (adenosine(37)-N6)-threonylcarbamoyltransferase complex ATPase subunit type 1 TsaE [Smithellaceae bacterium]